MTQKLLHARYWRADGTGENQVSHDPHGFGLETIETLAIMVGEWNIKSYQGVSLAGVVVNHHKSRLCDIGHQVHVAATAEQWESARKYWEGMK